MSAATVIRLRSRGESSWRAQMSPNRTSSVSDTSFGEKSPISYHHVIALCPTCHRRVHHGEDGETYNAELVAKLTNLEPV